MKILVTNDDGVYSEGLWAVVEALRNMAEVVAVASDREQSGVGTSVTLHAPVRVTEVMPLVDGTLTYAVEGTPADSVILALEKLVGKVDLVVSGINKGANLGEDVMISGTVGAALQGYCRDIPAVAVSVASLKSVRFDAAAPMLRAVAQQIAEGSLPVPLLLNINLPPISPEEIEGVDVTRLARRAYVDVVTEGGRRQAPVLLDRPQQAGVDHGGGDGCVGGTAPPRVHHTPAHRSDRGWDVACADGASGADAERLGSKAVGRRIAAAVIGRMAVSLTGRLTLQIGRC